MLRRAAPRPVLRIVPRARFALALLAVAACDDGAAPARDTSPRLNELQALGTHNSYHILAGPPADPAMDYQHAPLGEQLDKGVRHFEIDVHRDAVTEAVMVYHVKGIDEASTCTTLADCLGQLRSWSDAHPDHHALFVLIEAKDDVARLAADSGSDPAVTGELLWDGHIGDIDPVLRAAWPDRLVTPARVRGEAATLREAIVTRGWPTVDATRGELVVVLNDTGSLRTEYRALAGERPAFVFAEPADADAAFVKADDPDSDPAGLAAALEAGFIARTRADSDTEVDPAETQRALASGAQLVSSDYALARDDGAHPGYRLPWPGTPEHPSRCNPVTASPDCTAEAIE